MQCEDYYLHFTDEKMKHGECKVLPKSVQLCISKISTLTQISLVANFILFLLWKSFGF